MPSLIHRLLILLHRYRRDETIYLPRHSLAEKEWLVAGQLQ